MPRPANLKFSSQWGLSPWTDLSDESDLSDLSDLSELSDQKDLPAHLGSKHPGNAKPAPKHKTVSGETVSKSSI